MSSRWHTTCRKLRLKLTDLGNAECGWFQFKTNTKYRICHPCVLQNCQMEDMGWPVFPTTLFFISLSFTSLCILIGFCAPCCSCCLHTGGVLDLDICAEECKIGSILVPTSTHLSFFANSHLCRSRTRLMLIVHNGIAYKPTLVRQ